LIGPTAKRLALLRIDASSVWMDLSFAEQ